MTFCMVVLWKLPSSVTGHFTVFELELLVSLSDVQVVLNVPALILMRSADAVPTASARSAVAVRLASRSLV